MLEKLRKFRSDVRTEVDSAIGSLMIFQALHAKKQIKAEETFAVRIEAAIQLQEIQFFSQQPKDPTEEPIDVRLAEFDEFEDQGFAIYLMVKPEWLRKAQKSGDPAEREYFYEKLKLALQVIDELRKQGEQKQANPP